ncbi:MAG: hypothetical protein Q8P15_04085 [Nanoarchaeota archaeon]|nr:hypothetical protein [Nanoarchaeota archaeon]
MNICKEYLVPIPDNWPLHKVKLFSEVNEIEIRFKSGKAYLFMAEVEMETENVD